MRIFDFITRIRSYALRQKKMGSWLFFLIFAFSAVVQLVVAERNNGHLFDMKINRGWMHSAVILGVPDSYLHQVDDVMLPNHGPTELVMYWVSGHIYTFLFSGSWDRNADFLNVFIKLPGVLFNLFIPLFFFLFLRKRLSERTALLCGLAFLFQPIAFHNAPVWGQTDSIYSALILLAAVAQLESKPIYAGISLAFAILCKPQGLLFAPFILLLSSFRSVPLFVASTAITVGLSMLPFIPNESAWRIERVYLLSTSSEGPLSLNAFNLWWSLYGESAHSLKDSIVVIGSLTANQVGSILFSAAALLIAALLTGAKKYILTNERIPVILALLGLVSLTLFAFKTQMHERYFFPFIVLSLPFAVGSLWRFIAYAFVSAMLYLNVAKVLPMLPFDRAIFTTFPDIGTTTGAGIVLLVPVFFAMIILEMYGLLKAPASAPLAP